VYVVFAAQAGTVGTVLVADDLDTPSVVVYVSMLTEMKNASVPLENIKEATQ
jgi:hypothetical protein